MCVRAFCDDAVGQKRCFNAAVMRGAECHTDHQLRRVKVAMTSKWFHTGRKRKITKLDMLKLLSSDSERAASVCVWETVSASPKETWSLQLH